MKSLARRTASIAAPTRTIPARRWRALLAALAFGLAIPLLSAAPANASDWGGYANPASGCGSNYVVKQVPVYTSVVNGSALYVGQLQIKWSNGCPGNYARFAAAGGVHPSWIGISIHAQASPYNKAGADETNTDVAYTRVISLAHSSDAVCAYVDLYVQFYGQTTHAGAATCA